MRINKYFKLFESRSSNLSEEEFFKILKENCTDFISNPKPLQRVKKDSVKYSYINPKIHGRDNGSSASIAEITNLLIDNLASWKEFPKRNNSIIGTSNISTNQGSYGDDYYILIPYNNAKFGVTPAIDLWDVKTKTLPDTNININLSWIQSGLKSLKVKSTSYKELINDIQEIYNSYLSREPLLNDRDYIRHLFKVFEDEGIKDVEDGLNKYLAPDNLFGYFKSDFEVDTYNDLKTDHPYEIWTDSECLLYYLGNNYECEACFGEGLVECPECEGLDPECDFCMGNDNVECPECEGYVLDKDKQYSEFLEKIKNL